MGDLRVVFNLIMVFHLLQWNGSLISNGREFKKFLSESEVKPDIVCIQETWLRPHLDFIIPGYESVRFDREGNRGEVVQHL